MSRWTAASDLDYLAETQNLAPEDAPEQPVLGARQKWDLPLRADEKRRARQARAAEERAARRAVRKRDRGRCVVPGCPTPSAHLHHITYRSRGGAWETRNLCSLCPRHHQLVHARRITIAGNADEGLTIEGARKDLAR